MSEPPRDDGPSDGPGLPGVPGVVELSGAAPGPRVGVIGAIHGDEPCGLEAIARFRAAVEAGARRIARGTVVLIHGNLDATRERRRHTQGGVDLNRQFDFRFVDEVARDRWVSEHRRAVALRPVLESLDTVLDLHSTSAPGEPFSIVDPEADASHLAERVGPRWIVTRWGGSRTIAERTSLGVFRRLRRPALVVECGDHASPETAATARASLEAFLAAVGATDGPTPPPHRTDRVEVFDSLTKPHPGFRLARKLRGFSRLEAGEPLGARPDGSPDLAGPRAPDNCFALLPNEDVAVGEDVVYFARPSA